MKKILALLCVFVFIISSCSGDAETPVVTPTPPENTNILVKKIIRKDENDNIISISDYSYSGNKLLKITTNANYWNYTYVGNLISKIEMYNSSDVLVGSDEYFYNSSGNLSTLVYKTYLSSTAFKEEFVYNNDGTVTKNAFSGNLVSQTTPYYPVGFYNKLYFQNSELLKQEDYDNNTLAGTGNFIYDGKNNPTRNILGFDKIFFAFDASGNFQNLLHINKDGGNHYSNEYTYDSNNFPITKVNRDYSNNFLYKSEIFY
jgi:hypothetical protein